MNPLTVLDIQITVFTSETVLHQERGVWKRYPKHRWMFLLLRFKNFRRYGVCWKICMIETSKWSHRQISSIESGGVSGCMSHTLNFLSLNLFFFIARSVYLQPFDLLLHKPPIIDLTILVITYNESVPQFWWSTMRRVVLISDTVGSCLIIAIVSKIIDRMVCNIAPSVFYSIVSPHKRPVPVQNSCRCSSLLSSKLR